MSKKYNDKKIKNLPNRFSSEEEKLIHQVSTHSLFPVNSDNPGSKPLTRKKLESKRRSLLFPNSLRILEVQNFQNPTILQAELRKIHCDDDSNEISKEEVYKDIDDFLIPKPNTTKSRPRNVTVHDSIGMNINLITREFILKRKERIKQRALNPLFTFGNQIKKKKQIGNKLPIKEKFLSMKDIFKITKNHLQTLSDMQSGRKTCTAASARGKKTTLYHDHRRSIQNSFFKSKEKVNVNLKDDPLFKKSIHCLKTESKSIISIPASRKIQSIFS
ncbi:unnamed protein product [Moneuplotes crassus]|uniref:Uncharacterized protein n=1 Tax=Euplotes crassus TaxID=5936 RepID=A0AAD1UJR6_EUPCR|nr:unnamed protein product [Moneuplotes crassus]